jgi:muramoyltetrapeptide carboxypeptidase
VTAADLRLAPGAPIAVVAPAGIHDPVRLEKGLQIARDRGLNAILFPDAQKPFRYLAADDEHRARQLQEALSSPDWAAVWATRGGYGLTRILHRLNPDKMLPKPVLGFSDLTALFCQLHPLAKGPLVHAPVVHSLPITDAPSIDRLVSLLAGEPLQPLIGETWVDGEAEGWVCGGNLVLFAAMAGTPWQLDPAGAVVLLEEIGETPYRVDRVLQQLLSSGFFDRVAGVGIGQLEDCTPPEGATWTMRDLVLDKLGGLGIPIVGDLPFGHGAKNHAFPWGVRVRLGDGQVTFA